MTFQSSAMEGATVGELLRETRIKRGLDLIAVAEETRISPRNLQAIEDGNFTSLPAEVFTRGFYSLYARLLSLDPGEVLAMYSEERQKTSKTGANTTPPPNRLAQDMANLAERPTSLSFSYFGLILFLFLLFGAFLCWYFRWNPASYLSEKLRSLEEPQRIEQVLNKETKPGTPDLVFEAAPPGAPPRSLQSETSSLFSLSTVTAATTQPETVNNIPVELPKADKEKIRFAVPEDILR
ncbi:MAG: hypothetical protein ACD_75C00470G0007 [uncultured bacterium]|nr:MAG: hypothetical protein ACD_75C00470G0007 [uncultured bacterium]